MTSENLTEDNSKVVRLSKALCFVLEDIGARLDQKTINDTLNAIMRPVGHVIRRSHGKKLNLEVEISAIEDSITLKFSVSEKYVLKKLGEQ